MTVNDRMTATIRYDYNLYVFPEPTRIGFLRNMALVQVFANGNWANIIRTVDDVIVTEPIHSDDIRPGVLAGKRVEITLKTDRDIRLVGGLYELTDQARRNVVVKNNFHVVVLSGSGRSPEQYCKDIIRGYSDPKFRPYVKSILLIDYRGFGCSRHPQGPNPDNNYVPHIDYKPSSRGLYTDALAAINFLCAQHRVSLQNIILHGYSIGSGPAVHMAATLQGLGGLVLHSPIRSTFRQAKMKYQSNSAVLDWAAGAVGHHSAGFDNIKKIGRVNCPIYITCGPEDDMQRDALELNEEATKKKRKVEYVEHFGAHENTSAPFWVDGLDAFLGKCSQLGES